MNKRFQSLFHTLQVRAFAMLKIPLISYLKPVIEELGSDRCVVRFPLLRRSKNHLGSMYFGALCIAADTAGGLIAMRLIQERGNRISFVFKDFNAEFLRRPETDVLFVCEDGEKLRALVDRAENSGERVNDTVQVLAFSADDRQGAPVARFRLTISLKSRS